MDLNERILKLAKEADDSDRIIIFTQNFKIIGTLHKDHIERGMITLKDAVICDIFSDCDFDCDIEENCGCDIKCDLDSSDNSHEDNNIRCTQVCSCGEDFPSYDWLNIINEHIVSFSIIKN